MTQVELVKAWLEGTNEGKVGSVSVDGDRLVHYSTVIAERHGEKVILNYTRYSLASGKVQKMVTDAVPREDIIFVSGIDAGYKGSLTAVLADDDFVPPKGWLMRLEHRKFGTGYVTAVEDKLVTCDFAGQVKRLMWPDVLEMGLVEVLEDRRCES
jgi:hypothetical protein